MRKRLKRKFYRLNWNISAPKVRVIDERGKQIGILTKDKALKLARENEIDLVEVAPQSCPPVCKLIDFRKFLYQQKKKEKRKKEGKTELKEIRLRPFIGEHDYNIRLHQARSFLKEGRQVRIRIQFSGREITRKEFGVKLISRFLKDLEGAAKMEREPQFRGRNLIVLFNPNKSHGKKKEEKGKDKKDS